VVGLVVGGLVLAHEKKRSSGKRECLVRAAAHQQHQRQQQQRATTRRQQQHFRKSEDNATRTSRFQPRRVLASLGRFALYTSLLLRLSIRNIQSFGLRRLVRGHASFK